MAKIAIIGAGSIGTALTKLIVVGCDHDVILVDKEATALTKAYELCKELPRPRSRTVLNPEIPVKLVLLLDQTVLEEFVVEHRPDIIVCAIKGEAIVEVAKLAAKRDIHYLDFNEDEELAAQVRKLEPQSIFVPQTGLAPGLVSYFGIGLFELLEDEPERLDLFAGVLPQLAFAPSYHALVRPAADILKPHYDPVVLKFEGTCIKYDGVIEPTLLVVNGNRYEAALAASGIGDIASYEDIPTVSFKAIRHQGHFQWLEPYLGNMDRASATAAVERILEKSRDDYVLIAAHGVDKSGHSASITQQVYPSVELDMTAAEVCVAGTALGVIETMLNDGLAPGVNTAADLAVSDILGTAGLRFIFDQS